MNYIDTDYNQGTNINAWFEIDGETWGVSYNRDSPETETDEPELIDCDGMPVDLPNGEQVAMMEKMDEYVKSNGLLK